MNKETFELEGVSEVIDALEALDPKLLVAVIKGVERKSLTQNIVKPLKAALPYSAESEKNIKVVGDKEDKLGFYAGITTDSYWLRFAEKGTKIRTVKETKIVPINGEFRTFKEGQTLGQIIGKNIAIPTMLDNIDDIIEFFNEDFGSEVEKILKRRLKRLNKVT